MQEVFFTIFIEHFSYLTIFIFALFSGFLIPIPEEIIMLITGYMAWAGFIHLTPAIIVVIVAFIIGDNILFRLALKGNKHVTKLIHEVLSLKIIIEKRDFFEKHIGISIFLSRFIPFFRFIGPVFSGYIKTKEKTFLFFNSLAILIFAPFVIWVGYFFNDYLGLIVVEISKFKHVLFITILVIIGLLISRGIDYFLNKDHQIE